MWGTMSTACVTVAVPCPETEPLLRRLLDRDLDTVEARSNGVASVAASGTPSMPAAPTSSSLSSSSSSSRSSPAYMG